MLLSFTAVFLFILKFLALNSQYWPEPSPDPLGIDWNFVFHSVEIQICLTGLKLFFYMPDLEEDICV